MNSIWQLVLSLGWSLILPLVTIGFNSLCVDYLFPQGFHRL